MLVTVVQDEGAFGIDRDRSRKFNLSGSGEQEAVRAFSTALAGFVRITNIDRIAIRGRQVKGPFAGGPVSFKIEGFLQVLENCSVSILMPPTIAAKVKRYGFALPENGLKYQTDAYLVACAALV